MAVIAVASLCAALTLQYVAGRSDFLPKTDGEMIAVQVNTPSSASLDYNRTKVEKAAELARELPETKATNTNVNTSGGRVYIDLGRNSTRKRTSQQIAEEMRGKLKQI